MDSYIDRITALAIETRNDFVARYPDEALTELESADDEVFFEEASYLSIDSRLTVLERAIPERSVALFSRMSTQEQVDIVDVAPTHLTLELIPSLSEAQKTALFNALPKSTQYDLKRLVALPLGVAGTMIEQANCTLRLGMNVAGAIERVRSFGRTGMSSLYVVDAERQLAGSIDMQVLALADPEEIVDRYLEEAISCDLMAPTEDVVELLDEYEVDSLAVVDGKHRLIGVVQHDRLFDAIEESASSDMQTMVGASADELAMSTPGFVVLRRMPWLQINLLTAFLASATVALFEGLIAQVTALAVLLPVVAGQSGNAGAQALAVTVRSLALREIGMRDWLRLTRKELLAGIINGVALAIVCGAGVYLWSGSIGLALVISSAMTVSIPIAGISGALVPIVLTRLGQDPATASSIILTTVTDVTGFLLFLGIAMALSTLL